MKKWLFLLSGMLIGEFAYSQNYSFVFDGQTRNYIVHLPSGYTGTIQYPLVLNFHGYTSNAIQQELYSGMDAVADSNHFIVVYPDGLNNAWNVGFGIAAYNTGVNDVGFTNALIDTLLVHYSINANRVYACGMSNGGYLSHRLACELEDRIAAIASVTGLLTDSTAVHCNTIRHVPVMQVHGTSDPVVNYNGGVQSYGVEATLNHWITFNGCFPPADTGHVSNTNTADNTTVDWIRYTPCNASEVLFYKVYNGGHTWPGGAIDLPGNGNTNRDINASSEIWKFFNRFTLQGPVGIEENSWAPSVTIYPNPFRDVLHIQSDETIRSWQLLDITGKVICSGKTPGTVLELQGLAPGICLLRLVFDGGVKTVRLVSE